MNPPELLAVAFDMDGTMFNTEDLYDEVGELLLQRRGHEFDRQLKLEMMGLPGPIAFQIMIDRHGLNDSVETLQSECREIFQGLLPGRIATMPGLLELLDQLEVRGVPKCVATSSHRQFAETALGMFDLMPRFQFILTADDVPQGKPHPDIYLEAARRMGVSPAQMLVLEDSETGSRAAAAAGAWTVAVPTEHSQHVDFAHAQRVVASLEDPWIQSLFATD